MNNFFHKFALGMSRILGSMWAFFTAVTLIFIAGYHLGYTEKWAVESMVVIGSFLMLFFSSLRKISGSAPRTLSWTS